MAYADGELFIVSSHTKDAKYYVYAFNAANGKKLWENTGKWPNDNHGHHLQRPAPINGVLYVRPYCFDAKTGKLLDKRMVDGACGTYSGTSGALIYRANGCVSMWDMKTGKITRWTRLRPDCWLSTIPACGMILAPEGGGGCSCGAWMETSLGFLPKVLKE